MQVVAMATADTDGRDRLQALKLPFVTGENSSRQPTFGISLSFLRCAMLQRGTTIVIQYVHANGARLSIRRRDDDGLYQIWQDNVLEGLGDRKSVV